MKTKFVPQPCPDRPRFIIVENYEDLDAVYQFDSSVFSKNPDWNWFVRRCLPIEVPPHAPSKLSARGLNIFVLVGQFEPGVHGLLFLHAKNTIPPEDVSVGKNTQLGGFVVRGLRERGAS